MPSAQAFTWSSFYERIKDVDPDLRQMALFDLQEELKKETFQLGGEEGQCTQKLLICFTVDESNSEVHSHAVRLLEVFIPKANKASRDAIVNHLAKNMHQKPADATGDKLRALRDNASLALKTIVANLKPTQSDSAIVMATGLSNGLTNPDAKVRTEIFDVLAELAKTFGEHITASHEAIIKAAMKDATSPTPMLRKRATTCLANVSADCATPLFEEIMNGTVQGLNTKGDSLRYNVQIVSAISRAAGGRFAQWVSRVAPLLFRELERLGKLSDDEERESAESDETRENILQALENIIARCPLYVTALIPDVIRYSTELLSWDPNFCDDMDGEEMDDDEDDMELEDDDDSSWKVRKSASRLLLAVVRARADALPAMIEALLSKDALLVNRFNERVENVRLEILDLFRGILGACRLTGAPTGPATTGASGSMTGLGSFTQVTGQETLRAEAAALSSLAEPVVKALVRSAKHKSVKVKQAVFHILTDVFTILGMRLGATAATCVEVTVSNLTDARLALPHLRPAVLDFARVLVAVLVQIATANEDEKIVMEAEKLAPSVIRCTDERYYRTVTAALKVLHAFVAVVPIANNGPKLAEMLFTPFVARLSAADADQEVRRTALDGLAALLKDNEKTLSTSHASEVKQSFELIVSLLQNESTRIVAARACGQLQRCNLGANAVNTIASELAGFLRKTDRQVREQGLRTLTGFVAVHAATLPPATLTAILKELVNPNVNLISDKELFLTVLALQVAQAVVAVPSMVKPAMELLLPSITDLLKSPLAQGAAVTEAAAVLGRMAEAGHAAPIFDTLIKAVPTVDASALHNLSMAIGVVVRNEKNNQTALVSQCVKLAEGSNAAAGLACLGDIGRFTKLSAVGGLKPIEAALAKGNEDLKAAAATALGRAASSEASVDVLEGLCAAVTGGAPDLLLRLRALRECLLVVQANSSNPVLQSKHAALFQALVKHTASDNESIVEAAAECVGRLANAAPAVVSLIAQALPSLAEGCRAAVLSSVRFTMSQTQNATVDEAVRQNLSTFLAYLAESEPVRVRRAAVQLLTAAAYNRASFVSNDKNKQDTFTNLLQATNVNTNLIETIDLGPFKHTVDKGLDMRKQAFECISVFADSLGRPNGILESTGRIDEVVTRLSTSLKAPESDFDCWSSARNTLAKLARNPAGAAAIANNAEELGKNLKAFIALKVKEGQDKERVDDAVRGAVVTAMKLSHAVPSVQQNPEFADCLAQAEKSPYFAKAKEAVAE